MAGKDRVTSDPVGDQLVEEGHRFSFFQAIRLIHALDPDAPKVGFQGPVERERIRLRPNLSMGFPLTDIERVSQSEFPDETPRWHIDVNLMGLYGPASPLPASYTEDLLYDDLQGDSPSIVRQFLDLFHHRILSLLYRTWEKYRHTVQYDPRGRDYLSSRLLMLIGADPRSLPEDQHMATGRLLAYAGILTQRPRSAEALRGMLQDHFPEGEVNVHQCLSREVRVAPDQRNQLGLAASTLGGDLTLGDYVPDGAGSFGIEMGPVSFEDYCDFVPDRENMAQLNELVDMFNSDGLDYEVTMRLRGDQVPALQLDNPLVRLGYSSWLGSGAETGDRAVTFRFQGWKHGAAS